ncbi:hypothetical protein ACFQXA_25400 [Nocardiopsis composta]
MQCTRSARGEFARAAAMEWTRLASLRTTWWCLGIGAAAMAVFAVLMGISTADKIADDPASASEFSYTRLTSQGVFYLLQFVVLTLAALIATGEQANGGAPPRCWSFRAAAGCWPRAPRSPPGSRSPRGRR